MARRYTTEQKQFFVDLREKGFKLEEIMDEFNKVYAPDFSSISGIKVVLQKYGQQKKRNSFEDWQIERIKKEFDPKRPAESIKKIAIDTNLCVEQVRNKVSYLGLYISQEQNSINKINQAFKEHNSRLELLKKDIDIGSTVKVECSEHGRDTGSVMSGKVISIHPQKRFITIQVENYRVSPGYDEILEVL